MTDLRTPFDDDDVVESLLSGRGDDPVAVAMRELHAAADRPVPTPSAALAALLENGLPGDELSTRRRRRYVALGIAVSGATTMALTGVAAAHNALPGPAQDVVTDIVNNLTPFEITPHHSGRGGDDSKPTDTKLPGGSSPSRGRDDGPGDDRGGSGSGSDDSNSGSGGSGSGSGDDGSGSGSGDSGSGGSGSDSGTSGSGSGDSGSGGSGSDGSGSGSSDSGSSGSGSGDSGSGSGGSGGGSDGGGTSGSGSGGSGSGGGSRDGSGSSHG